VEENLECVIKVGEGVVVARQLYRCPGLVVSEQVAEKVGDEKVCLPGLARTQGAMGVVYSCGESEVRKTDISSLH